jgi:hypothetical protein
LEHVAARREADLQWFSWVSGKTMRMGIVEFAVAHWVRSYKEALL